MKVTQISLLFALLPLWWGCAQPDNSPLGRYRSAVTDGLDGTLTQTETVMGIDLGITDEAYYDRCTELNRQLLINIGRGGNEAEHMMENDLDRPAKMMFQPVFNQQDPRILQGISTEFNYQDWSPWNKEAYADKLLPDVADYLHRTLDVDFIELEHPRNGHTFASVGGGRHIAVWKLDDTSVRATITDLTALERDPLGLVQ